MNEENNIGSKYIRNPVTGLYEKVSENPTNNYNKFTKNNNSNSLDNNLYTPLGKDFSSPQLSQFSERDNKGSTSSAVSYDDMLKNLDHLVETQSPRELIKSPLDFNALSDSLDSLIKSASPVSANPRNQMESTFSYSSLGLSNRNSPSSSPLALGDRSAQAVTLQQPHMQPQVQSEVQPLVQSPVLPYHHKERPSPRITTRPIIHIEQKNSIKHSPAQSQSQPPTQQHIDLDELETKQKRRDWEKEKRDKMIQEMREAKVISEERERALVKENKIKSSDLAIRSNGPLGSFNENVDESSLPVEYIKALMSALRSDPTVSPIPEDFTSPDGFYYWQQSVNMRLQDVLIEILKAKYVYNSSSSSSGDRRGGGGLRALLPLKIKLKIIQARGLLTKEGRSRNPYCVIEFGNLEKKKEKQVFSTEILNNTLNPVWNQHLDILVSQSSDKINIEVWDKLKEQFLGRIFMNLPTLFSSLESEGRLAGWYRLENRSSKYKDKYVGGEIYLDISSDVLMANATSSTSPNSISKLQEKLFYSRIDYKSLFRVLTTSSLILDVRMLSSNRKMSDSTCELLSTESQTLVKSLARSWGLSEPFQLLIYVELLFNQYKQDRIPISALLTAYDYIHEKSKESEWCNEEEELFFYSLLVQKYAHFKNQLAKYKEFFPKNRPIGALETTILLLRMIHKNRVFASYSVEYSPKFTPKLRDWMVEAAIARYQTYKEITAPFDEKNSESVLEGLIRLADMMNEDILLDLQDFRGAFSREFDIARLTCETYLKYYSLTMESYMPLLSLIETASTSSKQTFALYRKLKNTEKQYLEINKYSSVDSFNVERWFLSFMTNWLECLEDKTLVWVTRAVAVDSFQLPRAELEEQVPSSSIKDVFSAIYQELEFIANLAWSNPLENSKFLLFFTKIINKAIEQYCDAIALGDPKPENAGIIGLTEYLPGGKANSNPQDKDIGAEVCTKLCNIQFAHTKLDHVYELMNMRRVQETLTSSLASPSMNSSIKLLKIPGNDSDSNSELFSGTLQAEILYAENIKPCTKAGTSNCYVVIRPPDASSSSSSSTANGTHVTTNTSTIDTNTNGTSTSNPLNGTRKGSFTQPNLPNLSNLTNLSSSLSSSFLKSNEFIKTRVIQETLNPCWNETFQVLCPPVSFLQVIVYSKNLLTSDEIAGIGKLELSKKSPLWKALSNHQTHTVYVELEPQGRLCLRLTKEGELDDVNFWFRKSKGRLRRTMEDFTRAITAKVSPFGKEILGKLTKEQEASALPSKSFFTSLTTNAILSDKTSAGILISTRMTREEAEELLVPLTDYLNKNFEILCQYLPMVVAHDAIRRVWDEGLLIVESLLIPPLFGPIDRDRKILNPRQRSLLEHVIQILKEFFHADGADLGIPNDDLESAKYMDICNVFSRFDTDLMVLKRECELGIEQGRKKEVILRLIRLFYEKNDKMSVEDKESFKLWLADIIEKSRGI